MPSTGFYPRPYPVCDTSGLVYIRTENGPEWTACAGCAGCAEPTGERLAAAQQRGRAAAALVLAAGAAIDDEPF